MNEQQLSCPAYDAIQFLQEKWVLHIIRTLLDGPRGFNELGREIGGCNPTTLTQRLVMLEGLQLVTKNVQSRMPPRCTYELSSSGRALEQVIDAIDSWARTHMEACQAPDPAEVSSQQNQDQVPARIAVNAD